MTLRRFPPPWTVEEQPVCLVVLDHNGQQLAYVFFERPRMRMIEERGLDRIGIAFGRGSGHGGLELI